MSAPENDLRTETPVPTRSQVSARPEHGVLVIAGVLAAIAGLLIYGNLTMKVANPGPFGPQAFPWIVAAVCLLAAALIVVQQIRNPRSVDDGVEPDGEQREVHTPTLRMR